MQQTPDATFTSSRRRVRLVRQALDVTWWTTAALAIILAVLMAFVAVTGQTPTNVSLTLPVTIEFPAGTVDLTADADVAQAVLGRAHTNLELSHAGPGVVLLMWTVLELAIGWVLVTVHLLRTLFRTFEAGTPFVQANVARLRGISAAIMVWGVAADLVQAIGSGYAGRLFDMDGVRVVTEYELQFGLVLVGAMVLATAEAFRHGADLQDAEAWTV